MAFVKKKKEIGIRFLKSVVSPTEMADHTDIMLMRSKESKHARMDKLEY